MSGRVTEEPEANQEVMDAFSSAVKYIAQYFGSRQLSELRLK
jgi:hypothetical protein